MSCRLAHPQVKLSHYGNEMAHSIHKVVQFQKVAPYTLDVGFEDGSHQVIDFQPILKGEMYGPLNDEQVFDQVKLDKEVHTLIWPNGADFDPATLYDWPHAGRQLEAITKSWTTKVG